MDRAMSKSQASGLQSKATANAVMRYLAQGDESGELGQAIDRGPQIWPAIGLLRG